jgi:hypothetical protein
MADVQITCIRKTSRDNTHEGITHLGNSKGTWSRADVIGWIESGQNTFYTLANNARAEVGVVNGAHGKYVRTHANGQYTDNLLWLPECI